MGLFLKIILFLIKLILNIISYLARKVWDEVLRLLIWGAILILIYFVCINIC